MNGKELLGCGLLLVCASARAQSINIDLDVFDGDEGVGNGAPSSGFGGAADSPGYWNRIDAAGSHFPFSLAGLDATGIAAEMLIVGGSRSGGYRNLSNTGDYARLLNDGSEVGNEMDFRFTGMNPGRYAIYTYAVAPYPMYVAATVTVPGADNPAMNVTGPMPGNQFILGVTHAEQFLTLTGDSFEIQVTGPWPNTWVNGMQVVELPVPEPGSGTTLGILAVAAAAIKRRRG